MARFISRICLFLTSCCAYAQEAKDAAPPETINVLGIIIFAVLFFGMSIGFFVYMWWRNKDGEPEKE